MPRDRVIRVFVSSTFHDMKAERDELVLRAFPQLRKLCDQRAVVWGEVDLRWGITDEKKAEGQVLPICLEEIRRCRPYFIGLLGERYGSAPGTPPADLLEREPWLAAHGNRSVTELEILHGVLNNPEMAEHAFFYFRDATYLDRLPSGADRARFEPQTPEDAAKVAALKQRIRASGFPVRENYRDPKDLAAHILRDFTALIDSLFPAESVPDPLDREAADHAAFARARTGVWIGRQQYLDRLHSHAVGDGPPLAVLGESGGGKSALLANWAAQFRQRHPDTLLLEHYIGGTPASVDWAAMLRRILGEFRRRLGVEVEIPADPAQLRTVFANALYLAAARAKYVLVLDALNHIEDRDGAPDLSWLPPVLPPGARLLVSTLPGRALEAIERRGWPSLTVESLDTIERERLIADYLRQFSKELAPTLSRQLAEAPQCANPLYLRALLEELRVYGDHATLRARTAHYLEAADPPGLYAKVLARFEQDYEEDRPGLVREAMTHLWAARRGLSESELMDLLGAGGAPLPRAAWSPFYLAAEASLVNRSGLIGFFHDYLRQAVRERYLADAEGAHAAHRRLADFFGGRELGARVVDELPWQLAEAAEWNRLADLLAEPGLFKRAWETSRFEVQAYWVRVEANSGRRIEDTYATVLQDPEGNVWHAGRVAELLRVTGHPGLAMELWQTAASHIERSGDRGNRATLYSNQAVILQARGRLEEALALHKKGEAICTELGDRAGLSASYGNQALILKAWGRLEEALALHKKQEAICTELGDRAGLSRSYGNQAVILQDWGRLEEALALHKKGEAIRTELGDRAGLSRSYAGQAMILKAWVRLEEALALHKKGEAICTELGDRAGLSASYGNQAVILQAWGRLEEALALLKKQEAICTELGDRAGLSASYGNQAHLLAFSSHQPMAALPLAIKAFDIAQEHGMVALRDQIGPILDEIRALAIRVAAPPSTAP